MKESEEAEEFRVLVSLERYFSDERARCYMSVSARRPVRALARRLRRAFRLPRPFALLSRGHLLPPDEPLALLRADDPVEVVPTKSASLHDSEANNANNSVKNSEEIFESRTLNLEDTPMCSSVPPSPSPPRSPASAASGRVHTPPSAAALAAAAVATTDVADLDHMKKRALDILEEYEAAPPRAASRGRDRTREGSEAASLRAASTDLDRTARGAPLAPPARRRRRVRRRRAPRGAPGRWEAAVSPVGREAAVSPIGREAAVSPVGREAAVSPVEREAGVSPVGWEAGGRELDVSQGGWELDMSPGGREAAVSPGGGEVAVSPGGGVAAAAREARVSLVVRNCAAAPRAARLVRALVEPPPPLPSPLLSPLLPPAMVVLTHPQNPN